MCVKNILELSYQVFLTYEHTLCLSTHSKEGMDRIIERRRKKNKNTYKTKDTMHALQILKLV